MEILDRLLGHDAWTTRQLMAICQRLTDEQIDRQFDIGLGTIRKTLLHIVWNMEVWGKLMEGSLAGPGEALPSNDTTISGLVGRLDQAAARLETVGLSVSRRGAWDECFRDVFGQPPQEKTFGAGMAHIITHSMHHRAQLLYMLRKLEVANLPEGDVFSWEHRTELNS